MRRPAPWATKQAAMRASPQVALVAAARSRRGQALRPRAQERQSMSRGISSQAWQSPVADRQAFLTQAVHQPLALTSLPPNTLHGPSDAPGLPEYRLQLLQSADLSLRLPA